MCLISFFGGGVVCVCVGGGASIYLLCRYPYHKTESDVNFAETVGLFSSMAYQSSIGVIEKTCLTLRLPVYVL